jgi:MOSC domain-containing protein YiiM
VYAADHYPLWREELVVPECGPGWFGENFSVTGQAESTVAIGDTYRIGTAVVQVSQPRAPCWKLGRRWNRLDMPKIVVRSGRTGWYLRVLEAGTVECGEMLTLLDALPAVDDRDCERRRVSRGRTTNPDAAACAKSVCPALAEAWRAQFRDLDLGERRIRGPAEAGQIKSG